MAGCYNHCYINVLAAHTGIKLNLYNSILTSIESLCAIDRYIGLIQTPRWAPMKNDRVQKIKETAEISKNRCEADLERINEVLQNGCPSCILRHCNEQEHLPVISNEMVEDLENLWALTNNAHSQNPNSPNSPEI